MSQPPIESGFLMYTEAPPRSAPRADSEEMMPEPYRMRPRSGIPEGLGRKGGTALGCRIPMIKRGRTIYIVHHGKTGDDGRCVDCGKRPRRKAEAGE